MNKVKLCKFCKKHGTYRESKGYTNEWSNDTYICPDCKHQMVDVNYPSADFEIIKKISYEPSFIESMIELKQKDPVEYQLKMSQFKTQMQLQQNTTQNDIVPRCPICNSLNLTKISAPKKIFKVGLFGIFGAGDLGKTWVCNDCGSKF